MAESGYTQLQILEAELSSFNKTLKALGKAEDTSEACSRVISNIQAAEEKDGFLVIEGGAAEQNQYHTSAGQSAGDGCCVVC